jgi:hypothetical protein
MPGAAASATPADLRVPAELVPEATARGIPPPRGPRRSGAAGRAA